MVEIPMEKQMIEFITAPIMTIFLFIHIIQEDHIFIIGSYLCSELISFVIQQRHTIKDH